MFRIRDRSIQLALDISKPRDVVSGYKSNLQVSAEFLNAE